MGVSWATDSICHEICGSPSSNRLGKFRCPLGCVAHVLADRKDGKGWPRPSAGNDSVAGSHGAQEGEGCELGGPRLGSDAQTRLRCASHPGRPSETVSSYLSCRKSTRAVSPDLAFDPELLLKTEGSTRSCPPSCVLVCAWCILACVAHGAVHRLSVARMSPLHRRRIVTCVHCKA